MIHKILHIISMGGSNSKNKQQSQIKKSIPETKQELHLHHHKELHILFMMSLTNHDNTIRTMLNNEYKSFTFKVICDQEGYIHTIHLYVKYKTIVLVNLFLKIRKTSTTETYKFQYIDTARNDHYGNVDKYPESNDGAVILNGHIKVGDIIKHEPSPSCVICTFMRILNSDLCTLDVIQQKNIDNLFNEKSEIYEYIMTSWETNKKNMVIEKEQTRIHNQKLREEKRIRYEKARKERQLDNIEWKLNKLINNNNDNDIMFCPSYGYGLNF